MGKVADDGMKILLPLFVVISVNDIIHELAIQGIFENEWGIHPSKNTRANIQQIQDNLEKCPVKNIEGLYEIFNPIRLD